MKKGFTLVELSIVLVAIGLIIGGILVGQSLIESAKLVKQIGQISQIGVAANSFKTKFKCIAGDCMKAPFTCGSLSSEMGDGLIAPHRGNSGTCLNYGCTCEAGLFGANLKAAGYAGKTMNTGINPPNNQYILSSVYAKSFLVPQSGNRFGTPGNWLILTASPMGTGWYYPGTNGSWVPVSANESKAYDAKTDDGLPLTGNVMVAAQSSTSHCATLDGSYNGACIGSSSEAAYPEWGSCTIGTGVNAKYANSDLKGDPLRGCRLAFKGDW